MLCVFVMCLLLLATLHHAAAGVVPSMGAGINSQAGMAGVQPARDGSAAEMMGSADQHMAPSKHLMRSPTTGQDVRSQLETHQAQLSQMHSQQAWFQQLQHSQQLLMQQQQQQQQQSKASPYMFQGMSGAQATGSMQQGAQAGWQPPSNQMFNPTGQSTQTPQLPGQPAHAQHMQMQEPAQQQMQQQMQQLQQMQLQQMQQQMQQQRTSVMPSASSSPIPLQGCIAGAAQQGGSDPNQMVAPKVGLPRASSSNVLSACLRCRNALLVCSKVFCCQNVVCIRGRVVVGIRCFNSNTSSRCPWWLPAIPALLTPLAYPFALTLRVHPCHVHDSGPSFCPHLPGPFLPCSSLWPILLPSPSRSVPALLTPLGAPASLTPLAHARLAHAPGPFLTCEQSEAALQSCDDGLSEQQQQQLAHMQALMHMQTQQLAQMGLPCSFLANQLMNTLQGQVHMHMQQKPAFMATATEPQQPLSQQAHTNTQAAASIRSRPSQPVGAQPMQGHAPCNEASAERSGTSRQTSSAPRAVGSGGQAGSQAMPALPNVSTLCALCVGAFCVRVCGVCQAAMWLAACCIG
eukprot:365289-Chlamydomonas_euryale.AAC.2